MMTKSSLSISAMLLFSAGACGTQANVYSSRELNTPNGQNEGMTQTRVDCEHTDINKMASGRVLVSKTISKKKSASSNREVIGQSEPQDMNGISTAKARLENILKCIEREVIDLNEPVTAVTIPSKSSAFKQYTRPKSSVSDRHRVTIPSKSSALKNLPKSARPPRFTPEFICKRIPKNANDQSHEDPTNDLHCRSKSGI